VVNDIAEEIRDILVFHLGCEEERLTDYAQLTTDLGADSLDIVEIVMSCEERFSIDIPNHVASSLVTLGASGCIWLYPQNQRRQVSRPVWAWGRRSCGTLDREGSPEPEPIGAFLREWLFDRMARRRFLRLS